MRLCVVGDVSKAPPFLAAFSPGKRGACRITAGFLDLVRVGDDSGVD